MTSKKTDTEQTNKHKESTEKDKHGEPKPNKANKHKEQYRK